MKSASAPLKVLLAVGALSIVPDAVLLGLTASGTFDDHKQLGLILSIAVLAWSAAFSIVAIVDVLRRSTLPGDERGMWVIAVILLGPLALPVWWWKLVRPLPYSADGPEISTT